MSEHTLPSRSDVESLLSGLLGDGVVVKDRPKPVDMKAPCVVAVYENDTSSPRRAVACDLRFANSAGAALSMIGPAVAAEATKSGKVPDNIQSNLHEVFNICVNIFTQSHREHLVLGTVITPANAKENPADYLKSPAATISFDIDVPKYGPGSISLIAVAQA